MKNKLSKVLFTGVLSSSLIACGSGSKELFGVYESKHAGIDFETEQAISDEFTYKYSFLPDGACVYYDGQKDMTYYTCSYQKESETNYRTEVILRASDNKTLKDSIVVKNGKSFEAKNEENNDTVTFTKTNEKMDTKSVIDTVQYSNNDKVILTAMTNFCKDPETHEFYSQNSKIPTMDSSIKGLKEPVQRDNGYIYPMVDRRDATDMLRAYAAIVMATTDCEVSQEDGYIMIKGGSGQTMLMASGDEDGLGHCFMVVFGNI